MTLTKILQCKMGDVVPEIMNYQHVYYCRSILTLTITKYADTVSENQQFER